jgi:small neutral amino acid transporter SnatA (MarC family)
MQLLRVKSCASRGEELNDNRSDTTPSMSPITSIQPGATPSSTASPQSIETGWLTANQKKLVAIVAGLILIVLLVAIRFRS